MQKQYEKVSPKFYRKASNARKRVATDCTNKFGYAVGDFDSDEASLKYDDRR